MSLEELLWSQRVRYEVLERELSIIGRLYWALALPFDVEAQTQSNWCWAATAKSVSRFYRPSSTWTQCRIAGVELDRSDCCNAPTPAPCNVPWYLDRALTTTKNFVSASGPVTIERIREELRAGRVVGARVGWAGGGGHFMVIYGASRTADVDYLHIDDPIYGKSQPSLETFESAYQGSGSWTTSYFTQQEPIVMKIKPYLLPPVFLRKIWETRPLLNLTPGVAEVHAPDELATTLAHPIYVLGLDELRPRRGSKRTQRTKRVVSRSKRTPVAIRVIELRGNEPSALFDVNTDEGDPKVLQASNGGPYLAQLAPALKVILEWLRNAEGSDRELSMLRVPALYVDALWLHGDNEQDALFVPVHAPFLGLTQRAYSAAEFMSALEHAAKDRRSNDDLIGP